MNCFFICGRLVREPEVKSTQTGSTMTRYTVAVDRRHRDADQSADYFNVIAFGRAGDFARDYFRKGMRVLVQGHVQTGSYTNKEGNRVNTFDVIADNQEFADGKPNSGSRVRSGEDEFMEIPNPDDYGVPF